MDNTYKPTKNKKTPLIIGIIVAVIAVVGLGIYFAYPMLKRSAVPVESAGDILKAETDRLKQSVEYNLSELENNGSIKTVKYSGTISLKGLDIEGTDYFDYLKADELQYDIYSEMATSTMSGIIGIAQQGNSIVELNFYKDTQNIYFSVPKLITQTFKISIEDVIKEMVAQNAEYMRVGDGTLDEYSQLIDKDTYEKVLRALLLGTGKEKLKGYASDVKAFTPYIFSSINTLWDNAEYEKGENVTISTNRGANQQDARTYTVTISSNALNKMLENAINSIYSDSKLTAYTSLITSVTKVSKDTLIIGLENEFKNVDNIKFNITVDDNDRIVGLWFDLSSLTGNATDCINISMAGNSSPSSYITSSISLTDNSSSIDFNVVCDTESESKAEKLSVNDFVNPVDVLSLTNSQMVQISRDLILNMNVLNQIFSEKALSEIMD